MIRPTPLMMSIPLLFGSASAQTEDNNTRESANVRSIALPGHVDSALARDFDHDGHDDLLIVFVPPKSERRERILRLYKGTPNGLHETHTDLRAGEDWTAIAFADWLETPGHELLSFDTEGIRAHPLDPREGPTTLRFHPQGRTLIELPMFFERADPRTLPRWSMVDDYDGNGLPEIWVPVHRGYARLVWQPGGRAALADQLDLGRFMATRRVYDNSMFSVIRELPMPFCIDIDGNETPDFVFEHIRGREVLYFAGTRNDETETLEYVQSARSIARGSRSAAVADSQVQKSFRRLVDLDSDGRSDLVEWKILGNLKGGMKFETLVEIRFAESEEGGPVRFGDARTKLFKNIAAIPSIRDLNGDQRADLLVVRTRAVSMLSQNVSLRYAIYLADGDGSYPEQPNFEWAHQVPSSALTEEELRVGRIPRSLSVAEDFDGDGIPDLLLVEEDKGFHIRRGRLERRTFEDRTWDSLQFEEDDWHAVPCLTSYDYDKAHFAGPRSTFLYFVCDESVTVASIPR